MSISYHIIDDELSLICEDCGEEEEQHVDIPASHFKLFYYNVFDHSFTCRNCNATVCVKELYEKAD